jgi:surface antigen
VSDSTQLFVTLSHVRRLTRWRLGSAAASALCCWALAFAGSARAAPAATTHSKPVDGVSGVSFLCGPVQNYSCTTGGYNASAAENSGWPWSRHGPWASYVGSDPHTCTLYAAFRLQQNGLTDPGWLGDATDWDTSAYSRGVPVDQSAAVGSIAQWNTGVGHVAYVESVDSGSTGITITEDNYVASGSASYPGGYTARIHISSASPAWPDNFLHFKDQAPGGGGPGPPADTAPVVRQLPSVTGEAHVGGVVACSEGSWANAPTKFDFQWLHDGTPIPGEASGSHVVAASDGGHSLACRVVASNSAGFASATSQPVNVPTPTVGTPTESQPVNVPTPTVGTPTQHQTTSGERCVVPNLRGRTLAQGRKELRVAHCSLGLVRNRRGGAVVWQSRRPGTRIRRGARVDIRLGPRR